MLYFCSVLEFQGLNTFPGNLIALVWLVEPPLLGEVRGSRLTHPLRPCEWGWGGWLYSSFPSYLGRTRIIIHTFKLQSWAASRFDIMITVHSILSELKLEATLRSLLGIFLGAKHFFKGF